MVLKWYEDICIAGSSTRRQVEVKLIPQFLLNISSLAIKKNSAVNSNIYTTEDKSLVLAKLNQ